MRQARGDDPGRSTRGLALVERILCFAHTSKRIQFVTANQEELLDKPKFPATPLLADGLHK
jgi:hypothetical protein